MGDDKDGNKGSLSIGEEMEGHDFIENPYLDIKFGSKLLHLSGSRSAIGHSRRERP